jgi:hypothetical protein
VDIAGIDRGKLIVALYNAASPGGPQSMGWLHWKPGDLSPDEEHTLTDDNLWIDYLGGRALKVGFEGDALTSYLYDREYGEGAAQRIVDNLRAQPDSATPAGQ